MILKRQEILKTHKRDLILKLEIVFDKSQD